MSESLDALRRRTSDVEKTVAALRTLTGPESVGIASARFRGRALEEQDRIVTNLSLLRSRLEAALAAQAVGAGPASGSTLADEIAAKLRGEVTDG